MEYALSWNRKDINIVLKLNMNLQVQISLLGKCSQNQLSPKITNSLSNKISFCDLCIFELIFKKTNVIKFKIYLTSFQAFNYQGECVLAQDKCGEAIRALQESDKCNFLNCFIDRSIIFSLKLSIWAHALNFDLKVNHLFFEGNSSCTSKKHH